MTRTEKPIVARVNGPAMGGGLGLVAASTLRDRRREAKLGTPEIDVGLFPMMIMAVLARVVPRRELLEMMLLGKKIERRRGARASASSRAPSPPPSSTPRSTELTDAIAKKSPLTVAPRARGVRRAGRPRSREGAARCCATSSPRCLGTDDAREGLMAFLEKRTPQLDGKIEMPPMNMRELVADLEARRDADPRDGRRRARSRSSTSAASSRRASASQRFFDDGVYFEVGAHGTQMGLAAGPDGTDKPPPTPSSPRSARSTAAWCAAPRTTSP